ncbi:hypothetical protein RIF29_29422 [Crotalaria pallida]|uniref:FBD domain-containing protein n=1 Tax=Crotalaria pallida TaxID=3830 RepID=A0AAN9ELC4_CROPI
MKLPSGVPGSRTLVVLKLSGLSFNDIFIGDFPSLKIMHLTCVDFSERGHLVQLLLGCPILEHLHVDCVLVKNPSMHNPEDKEWVHQEYVPECFSSHLEKCTIINYGGHEGELRFAKYVMQKAKVLCTMRICSETDSNPLVFEMLYNAGELIDQPWWSISRMQDGATITG